MSLFFNGVQASSLFFNGVQVTTVFFNGVQIAFGAESDYLWGGASYTNLPSGISGIERGEALFFGSDEVFLDINGVSPTNFAGNRINDTGSGFDWTQGTNDIKSMGMTYQYWTTGATTAHFDFLWLDFYVVQGTGQPDGTWTATCTIDGVEIFQETLNDLVNTYGFVWGTPSGSDTHYTGPNSTAPNQSANIERIRLSYTGPIGSAGNATVRQWIDDLLANRASDNKDRRIILSDV